MLKQPALARQHSSVAWTPAQTLIPFLTTVVKIREAEVAPALYSFFTLFSLLASYFLLLPLREDAGISLGTSMLPTLFTCSLAVTLIVTPSASAFLSRNTAYGREKALKRFYACMALVLLGFYMLYNISTVELLLDKVPLPHQLQSQLRLQQHHKMQQQQTIHQQQQQQRQLLVPLIPGIQVLQAQPTGVAASRKHEHTVEGLQQALAIDSKPAIGQGDTLHITGTGTAAGGTTYSGSGSGVGSHTSSRLASNTNHHTATASNSSSATPASPAISIRQGDSSLSKQQRILRAAFYVYVNVMNLVGISALWARCSDAFSPDAAARLFGFISAGATLGQLAGSLIAVAVSWASAAVAAAAAVKQQAPCQEGNIVHGVNDGNDSHCDGTAVAAAAASSKGPPASGLILLAALLQLVGAQLVCRVRPMQPVAKDQNRVVDSVLASSDCPVDDSSMPDAIIKTVYSSSSGSSSGLSRNLKRASSIAENGATHQFGLAREAPNQPMGQPRQKLYRVLTGFRLIMGNTYLLMLCGNLLLTYVVGSLMYFQRALAVSTALGSASNRTAFFAALNTWSGAAILIMQLTATSGLLRRLGMPAALALGPVICLLGIAVVCWRPYPAAVAGFEIVRKVFGYAVNRPAREVLFTVVTREEKYSAKLIIDTLVQRLGDAIAAGVFQVLDVQLRLGESGVGAAGCLMCLAWLATAHKLGQQHSKLADTANGSNL